MEAKEKYITHSALLKERGWTEKLVKMFLNEPCMTRDNPYYKKASPMKLYRLERVEISEGLESFKAYVTKKSATRKKLSEITGLPLENKIREK